MHKHLGLIHVYTGDGKGKTSSAVGLACRALGSGFRVAYCSFHKRPEKYGYTEMKSLETLGAEIHNFAKGHPHLDKRIREEDIRRETVEALQQIRELYHKGFDLIILDEILISVRDVYISESDLISLIKEKPPHTELVLTGRAATAGIMALADYVSFVKKLKHPYDTGIKSRKGIEY